MGDTLPVSILNSKPRMGRCIPSWQKTSQCCSIIFRRAVLCSSGQSRHCRFVSSSSWWLFGSYSMRSSRCGSSFLSSRITLPLSWNSQSRSLLVSARSSGSSYRDFTCGRHILLGTFTGSDPSGCPSLAIFSSSSVAEDAANVLAAWLLTLFRCSASFDSVSCGSHSIICSLLAPIPPAMM